MNANITEIEKVRGIRKYNYFSLEIIKKIDEYLLKLYESCTFSSFNHNFSMTLVDSSQSQFPFFSPSSKPIRVAQKAHCHFEFGCIFHISTSNAPHVNIETHKTIEHV